MVNLKVSNYALVDVLYRLASEGLKDLTITKEDNDLIIRIDEEDLSKVVYPAKTKETPKLEKGL